VEAHKRTEITIEKNEVLVVRRTQISRGWCPECGREVEMVGMPDANAIVGMSGSGDTSRSLRWHICGDPGSALVCLESLLKSI
jgi:hypothetical protein